MRSPGPRRALLPLHVAAGEDRGDVVEDVRRADVAVAVGPDEAALHDLDLLLGVLVDDGRDEARQLDRVLLVLEELQLEGLLEPLVRLVVEGLPLDREGPDVVHDLAAEVVLARLGDVDLLLDRAHEPLVGLLVAARVAVADLLLLRVGLHVVDVVAAQALDRLLVGRDRPLDLVLDDVLVLLPDEREEVAVALARLLGRDQGVVGEPLLELVHHHEGVDAGLEVVADERVADLVLDVARRDPAHPLAGRLLPQLPDVVLREARQRLAVVELELLEERQVRPLGLLQPREDRPHRRHLDRVGRDVLAGDLPVVEVLLVDLDLFLQDRVVRDVDLEGPVAERLHQLVVLELAELRGVRVPDDDLVDVGLGELLRLDRVLLGRPEEVVEEGDVELQDLDELDDPAVGDVELPVEVEGARVGVGAVLGDPALVQVPRQLRRVLVLLVLRLEGPDPDPVLLRQDEPADPHVAEDPVEVPAVALHELAEVVAAGGAQLPLDLEAVPLLALAAQRLDELLPRGLRDELQGLLVHRAVDELPLGLRPPPERVERPLGPPGVVLDPLLQEPDDRRLARPDGAVEEHHPPLGAVAEGGGLEDVDEVLEGLLEAEEAVLPPADRVLEELVADDPLLPLLRLLDAVEVDHVVEALEGVAQDEGVPLDDLEVVLERPLPVLLGERLPVDGGTDDAREVRGALRQGLHASPLSGPPEPVAYRRSDRIA